MCIFFFCVFARASCLTRPLRGPVLVTRYDTGELIWSWLPLRGAQHSCSAQRRTAACSTPVARPPLRPAPHSCGPRRTAAAQRSCSRTAARSTLRGRAATRGGVQHSLRCARATSVFAPATAALFAFCAALVLCVALFLCDPPPWSQRSGAQHCKKKEERVACVSSHIGHQRDNADTQQQTTTTTTTTTHARAHHSSLVPLPPAALRDRTLPHSSCPLSM